MTARSALWRFVVSAAIVLVIFIVIMNVLRQPVAGETRVFTAEFADASGLRPDADVRVRGVRVGKVQDIALERRSGQSVAAVRFSLADRYGVVPTSRLSIKYQALTGLRYLDITNPVESDAMPESMTRIPVNMTQPSFDITTLFNGLQPVLATLSPQEIDIFTQNAANLLTGDGGGLAPMLDSIRRLTQFTSDRQQVISTLMTNLNAVADEIGGHSKDLVQIIEWVNRPLDASLTVLDEFRKSELYGPGFTSAASRLLLNMGFDGKTADIDLGLDRAFTVLDDFTESVKKIPVIWDDIGPPAAPGDPVPCSRGRAQLPESMDVLLNGQRVILCNQ
ncbi:mammalian cell entry protein [Mycolicibacterium peregrinum]|uniref:Mammalian cell entry protein n=1 Tax=Mycolicibacterium peregrinum TaxID=43304 RepID=A0A1A0QY92_MYCPR|nr:MlaD family protein [Mycolicibacterium peregrinum]OBB27165.1 mammalian cell entry protein [Mycolicibacterium peregrinum]